MRFGHTIYPEGMEKLRKAGIEAKVKKLKNSKNGLPYIGGSVFQRDIFETFNFLKKKGCYKNIPKDFAKHYQQTTNELFQNPEKFSWTIQKPSGSVSERCELEDLVLFLGEYPHMILGTAQMWDYKTYGFSNPTEFIGLVSAYIIEQSNDIHAEGGYAWTTKRKDGSQVVTEVTGDINADLRVFQTDITPYPTTDPFGNSSLFRPVLHLDRYVIAAYHSEEPRLFVAAMKYAEQQGIKVSFWEKPKDLVSWARSLGRGVATCAEHYGGFDKSPRLFFPNYDLPIPVLDKNNMTSEHTAYSLATESDVFYKIYISNQGNLVASLASSETPGNIPKRVSAEFLPEDVERLLKGLIYQSASNKGRTSPEQLLNIFAFRFSEQFKKDRDELRDLIKH